MASVQFKSKTVLLLVMLKGRLGSSRMPWPWKSLDRQVFRARLAGRIVIRWVSGLMDVLA
ncbi:hypothetical protein Pyn_06311 [Prunus yedoensis var. nudiflora]|uniref:Uncharacterized protein n=1 Tax=Prunus yedoensis var. nudiflora TaxID=2094558 RepID=A0A314YUN0_PRUYE|nr:hypothetical protein Pyn_06311 [Prunus yedoensis var. nudiflora]